MVPHRRPGFYPTSVGFSPALNAARTPLILPGFDAPVGGVADRGLLDYMFVFGPDLLVTGAFLLYASRQPARHMSVLWLVVALEFVRGILDDIYMLAQGSSVPVLLGFIVLHTVIIVTGVSLARQVQIRRVGVAPATQPA